MTPSGKTTLVALLTVAGLGLTSCSADDDAPAAEQSDLESLMATDARGDQRAAGGATAMAMELGFEQVQAASESEIEAVRGNAADRAGTAEELTVEPAACAQPIAELDWSPILAPSDAVTRVDFSTGNFQGAGSVEVAGITEDTGGSTQAADDVATHQRAVEEITTNCHDLTMMLADDSEPDWAELEYTFTAEPVETESGSGLRWQRYPTDDPEGQTTTALTMMTEHDGYAIQVAFIGGEDIGDDEFTDITEAILASAVAQLD
ncbi:hypothetical protein GCM10023190_12750 [Enteractinococcus fodinae]|uniref:Sensor domain-containing protein n=1 Tax=Enteractinococcus fodinae TaxID=684663 RepID=A0ABU2AYX3_9MICC|nr:hypothetical protein [Enteractinococcus fodinae]MDR7346246.1 hypothetical protein [Enteractinococcus fodinae]